MSTRDLTFAFAANPVASVTNVMDRAPHEKLGVAMLTVTFLFSYLQYCLDRNDLVRIIPIAMMVIGTLVFLLASPQEKRREYFVSACHPVTLLIVGSVCLPSVISSYFNPPGEAFVYGFLMILVLLTIRILLSGIGFEGLFSAFFYATSIGLLVVVGITIKDLIASVGATRYAPMQMDPNRIAFFAATAIPAQLYFVFHRRRYSVLLITGLSVFVVFAASSRGSIGGLAFGVGTIALLYVIRLVRFGRFEVSRTHLMGLLLGLCLMAGVAATHGSAVDKTGQFLRDKLAFDSSNRGVGSGFTGRSGGWAELFNIWPKTQWLAGNGFRTSDVDFTFSVDNGYIATLYELGAFSTSIAVAKYLFVLFILSKTYVSFRSADKTCLVFLIFVCSIFFANAFVHRVFLGYGEQSSMLLLFVFVALPSDVFSMLQSSNSRSWSPANENPTRYQFR
jgi:hypothetical protein